MMQNTKHAELDKLRRAGLQVGQGWMVNKRTGTKFWHERLIELTPRLFRRHTTVKERMQR